MVWLYQCMGAGLSMGDLGGMRIDQAEALIELQEFVGDAIAHREEDDAARDAESAFWGL